MSPAIASRRLLVVAGALLALASLALAWQLRSLGLPRLPLYDFAPHWAAARLNSEGSDPYDPESLAALERSAEPEGRQVLVMWAAPWALTLLGPFGRMDAPTAQACWLLLLLLALLLAVAWAWRFQGGSSDQVSVAWLVAFVFLPTYLVLVTGQFGPLVLLGFVGFLHFQRRGQEGVAGAFLVLAALKPALSLLFWLALLLWAVERRRWRLVLGGLAGTVLLLAWPLLDNPHLLEQYAFSLTRRTPTHSHPSPLLGTALRALLGWQHFWLQFVPLVPGLAWLVWYYRRHRLAWVWAERLPALLFASLLAAPYGAWPFDLVILLIALLGPVVRLQSAGRQAQLLAGTLFLAVNGLALLQLLTEADYFWFFWLTPALLLTRICADRAARATARGAARSGQERSPGDSPGLSGVASSWT
jgi:hypothetical protein